MTILALDTTSEVGSLAVRCNGKTVGKFTLESAGGFSHLIFPAIDEVLRQAGVRLVKIDYFAAASGPGSFTGVRVGLSAVKGLAEATGKRAIGISTLQALASFGNLPFRAVILPAGRGQVYRAVYDARLRPVSAESVGEINGWFEGLKLPSKYEVIRPSPGVCLAAGVAACAEMADPQDPASLDANYVRRSDAELFWKDG